MSSKKFFFSRYTRKYFYSSHRYYYSPYQGSIIRSKNIIYFPPFLKLIFFPLSRHIIFLLPKWPFCLNSSLFFALILSFYFFLRISFSFLPFPFLPFLLHFPPFSLPLFIFFPQMTLAHIFPPGGDIFQYIDPCTIHICVLITQLFLLIILTNIAPYKSNILTHHTV